MSRLEYQKHLYHQLINIMMQLINNYCPLHLILQAILVNFWRTGIIIATIYDLKPCVLIQSIDLMKKLSLSQTYSVLGALWY